MFNKSDTKFWVTSEIVYKVLLVNDPPEPSPCVSHCVDKLQKCTSFPREGIPNRNIMFIHLKVYNVTVILLHGLFEHNRPERITVIWLATSVHISGLCK